MTISQQSPCEILLDEVKNLLSGDLQPRANQSLSELGVTSLAAVTIQYRLSSQHGMHVTLEQLMGPASIAEITQSQG